MELIDTRTPWWVFIILIVYASMLVASVGLFFNRQRLALGGHPRFLLALVAVPTVLSLLLTIFYAIAHLIHGLPVVSVGMTAGVSQEPPFWMTVFYELFFPVSVASAGLCVAQAISALVDNAAGRETERLRRKFALVFVGLWAPAHWLATLIVLVLAGMCYPVASGEVATTTSWLTRLFVIVVNFVFALVFTGVSSAVGAVVVAVIGEKFAPQRRRSEG